MPRRKKQNNRFFRLLGGFAGVLLIGATIAADWTAHQPRAWQQTQTAKLPPPLAAAWTRVAQSSADLTDTLGLTGHDAEAPLAIALDTNRVLCAGVPQRLPGCKAPDDLIILKKKGFIAGYSPSLRHPVWVAYRAFPVRNRVPPQRPTAFHADPDAPRSPSSKEYTKTGYDRGHLAPNLAIATRYGKAAQEESFLTSNICPQRPSLNQGPWCDLEFRIADLWPDRYGSVWVITGAISESNGKRLASGIDIPDAFYQLIVSQHDGTVRALAVCMSQNIRRHAYTRTTLLSVDELEKLTGFDFLADLPDETENKLEAQTPTRLWPAGLRGTFRLIREHLRVWLRTVRMLS